MKYRKFIQIILVAMAIFSLGSYLRAEVPAGYYYAADGKSGAELKTALHQIVSAMHTLDYGSGEGATWEGFSRTDRLDDGRVWDRYSSEVRDFDGDTAVDCMHIEHSFPNSWWGAYENNAYRDLHHLYPADGSANSSKNNLPLGEVTGTPGFDNGVSKIGYNGFGTDYTDRCFEPADEYKGDFARAYLYVVTAYENLYDYWQSPMVDNNTYPVWKNWARNLLLEWHRQDPPSEREMARNDSVYTIQGNRNPYIDYPDLVEYVWGDHVGQAYAFPEETAPFLAMPRYGESVDMGVILAGDSRSAQLEILGDNLTSALSIAWTQGNIFSLSATTLSPQQVSDGYSLEIACDRPAQGEYRDTLTIVGGGLERQYRIPVQLIVVPSFIVTGATDITASEATVQWVNYPSATDYRVSLWRGNTYAGDLIISAYVEGSSYNKAIELYNGTGAPVDLSAYSLRIESNGGGSFYNDTPLGNAVLQNGETWLLLNEQSTRLMFGTRRARSEFGRAPRGATAPVELLPTILPARDSIYSSNEQTWCIKLRVRSGSATYVVMNISALVDAWRSGSTVTYGKNLSFAHTPEAFTERARELLKLVSRVAASQRALFLSRWKYQEAGSGTEIKELIDIYNLGMANANWGIQFYQNVTGSFINIARIKNVPMQEYWTQNRNVEVVPEVGTEDFYEVARTNLIYGNGAIVTMGIYQPNA